MDVPGGIAFAGDLPGFPAHAAEKLKEAGVERICNGHYAYKPLTIADTDVMVSGMERVCSGTAAGKPFENEAGRGTEYAFGEWSVLCRE